MKMKYHIFCLLIATQLSFGQENYGNLVNYELSLINKTLGDELFIINECDSAAVHYNKAQKYLKDVNSDEEKIKQIFLDLLKKDIEYRSLLLQHQYSFWGVTASGEPKIPLNAFARLKSNSQRLKVVYQEIMSLYNMNLDTKDKISEADAKTEWNSYKKETFEIDNSKFELIQDQQKKIISEAKARLSDITSRQKQLDRLSKSNIKSIDQAVNQLNDAIMDGVKVASGLPPELSNIDPSGSLEQNIVNIGTNMITSSDNDFTQSFGKVGEQLNEFRKVYQLADSVNDKIGDYQNIAKKVHETMKKPTLESLLDVGSLIYNELPDNEKEKILKSLRESKPVGLLMEIDSESKNLKKAISNELAQIINDTNEIAAVLEDYIAKNEKEAIEIYSSFMKEIDQFTFESKTSEVLLETIIKNWPSSFLSSTNDSKLVSYLKKKLGAGTIPQLRNKLKSLDLSQIPELKISNGKLIVESTDINIDFKQILKIPSENQVETDLKGISEDLKKLIADFKENQTELLTEVLTKLPPFDIQKLLGDYLVPPNGIVSSESKDNLFGQVMSSLDDSEQAEVYHKMANVQVGSEFISKSKISPNKISDFQDNYKGEQKSSGDQMMDMALAGGLDYMAPGVSVALKVWDKVNAVEELVEKQNEYFKEIKQLTVQQLQLEYELDNAGLQLGIAKAEQEVSIIMQKASQSQYDIYSRVLNRNFERLNKNRAKIKLRVGYYYYLAEILRRDYYLLDNSLKLWFGNDISELIKSNPQNIRYALDQDILLFNWLDKDIESQRGDLDKLTLHWERLVQLIDENCEYCSEEDVNITNVQEAELIKLSEITSENQWSEFKKWKDENASSDSEFKLYFTLSPELNLINKKHGNARIVNIRMGGVSRDGKPIPLSSFFTLEHSGMSVFFENGKVNIDYLNRELSSSVFNGYEGTELPDNVTDFNWPKKFDGESLIVRWVLAGGNSRKKFEGYGLYSGWKLEVQNPNKFKDFDDFYIRIAYQYVLRDAFLTENDYTVIMTLDSGNSLEIDKNELRNIGNRKSVDKYLYRMVNSSEYLKEYKIVTRNGDEE